MAFKLEIPSTRNAAFDEVEGNAGPELARILRELADRVEGGVITSSTPDGRPVLDVNGSTVGEWTYTSDSD